MESEKVYRMTRTGSLRESFRKFAQFAAHATGSVLAFSLALLIVLVWAATGPLFHFSDTWQLVINTGTTVVTFLMVFLIQSTQNRDSQAIHAKLDELLVALKPARNHLLGAEEMSEEELASLKEQYQELAEEADEEKAEAEKSPRRRGGGAIPIGRRSATRGAKKTTKR
jgi:low affinity Fe/Cu permease